MLLSSHMIVLNLLYNTCLGFSPSKWVEQILQGFFIIQIKTMQSTTLSASKFSYLVSYLCTFTFHLTHSGRVTHICVSELVIIGSDIGLSPGRHQAIIWTIAAILLNWTLRTNFNEKVSEIHTFSFKKMHVKMSSGISRPFCLGLNVLNQGYTHIKM